MVNQNNKREKLRKFQDLTRKLAIYQRSARD